jgi:hypothetical protein
VLSSVYLTYSNVFNLLKRIVAEFQEGIRMAIPDIMACLIMKDPAWRVRQAAINGFSSLAAHRMYNQLSSLDVLTDGD